MTTLADLNPFTQIVSHPHVVPQAVERVIQATVSADYLNRRLIEAARANLLGASDTLNARRTAGIMTEFDVQLFYKALDRVAAAQDMAASVFG